jgi:alpha,alpha-trehalose phosphorylase
LPEGWTRLHFRLKTHNQILDINILPGETEYQALNGGGLKIWHKGEPMEVVAGKILRKDN